MAAATKQQQLLLVVTSAAAARRARAATTEVDAAAAAAAAPSPLSAGSTSAEVAKDGRPGSFPTIALALEHAPADGSKRHVIFIRAGKYEENLNITRANVSLVGEGMGRTAIRGARCNGTRHDTASSATVSVSRDGFLAMDMTIENYAGVNAGPAVALLSKSHESVVYRCELLGFQDTLCAEGGDQFYKSCIIKGTVDFVFGNARAFFQDCKVLVRRPPDGGYNVVTAQGRNGSDYRSGFVFQRCSVAAAQNLTGVDTFLGRPWRNHSHVVFVDSFLDAIVHPQGWVQWNRSSEDPIPSTVYYGEFRNRGPGANTSRRAGGGSGFHNLDLDPATVTNNFTVTTFIGGNKWIPRFQVVPYYN